MMKAKYAFSGLIAAVMTALFHILVYPYIFRENIGNVFYYILFSSLFIITFFAVLFYSDYLKFEIYKYINYIFCLGTFFFIVWFFSMYFFEKESYYFFVEFSLRHRINFLLYFLLVIVFASVILLAFRYFNKNIRPMRLMLIFFFSGIQTLVLYAPNIINDLGGNLYHIHAYFNPIYNITKGLPYNNVIKSIYGHYPIFYFIPMKILSSCGLSMVDGAMIITMIFGFISFVLLYFSLNKLIKKDTLFFVSILSISYISFYYYLSGQYYQILPHRILFPSLVIFLMALFNKKQIPYVLIIIASSLALLWNFESGIICLVVLTFYSVLYDISNKKTNAKRVFCILSVFFISILIPFLTLNLVNLVLGGSFQSFKDFIFPLMSDDFDIGLLEIKIPTIFSLYFFETVVFLYVLCVFGFKALKHEIEEGNIIVFSCSLMGLGLLPYYFNRAAFANISIVHIPFIFVLCLSLQVLLEKKITYENIPIKRLFIFCSIIILSFFSLGALTGIPLTIFNRIDSTWNKTNYNILCETIEEEIPMNTAAVGPGLSDIYSSIKWDPQIYIMDWSDWEGSAEIRNYAISEINSKDAILLGDSSNVGNYIDWDEWFVSDLLFETFYYMIRVKDGNSKKDMIVQYTIENSLDKEDFICICILNYYKQYPSDVVVDHYYEEIEGISDWNTMHDIIYNDYRNAYGL